MMLRRKGITCRRLACLALLTASVVTAGAQGATAQQSSQAARFGASTSGVILDVVVRDKKGPVTDLTADDFEVLEDGTPQKILTFEKPVTVGPPAAAPALTGASAVAKPAPNSGDAGLPVIALAFDRLSPEGRALARKAALQFLGDRQPNEFVGVFVLDQSLRTMSPYTADTQKIQAGIDAAASTATTQTKPESSTLLDNQKRVASKPATASAESGGSPGLPVAQAAPTPAGGPGMDTAAVSAQQGTQALLRVADRMDRSYRDMLADIGGMASIDALLALVDSLGELPGRQTVVYLCEGLAIPAQVEPRFRSVIDTANRRNIAIYALDAAGLRVHSSQAATSSELSELTSAVISGTERPETGGAYTKDLERNEQLLREDPSASLGLLADQTGGILIQNTNALDRGIKRINEDRRFYYLLGYTPTNAALDGTYRRVQVKVKRPGVAVRARSGYMAVPADTGAPIFAYEAPALKAMATRPAPAAFPIETRALSLPMPGRPGLTALMVGVSTSSVTFAEDAKLGTFAGEATILASVSDSTGGIARKQSQQFKFTGKTADLPKAKAGGVLFFRTPDLQAGKYAMTAVVYDVRGSRASVKSTPFEVPPFGSVVIGDLFIVGRVERAPANDPEMAHHPLNAAGVLLQPSFGEPISKAKQAEVAFAVVLLIDPSTPAPAATLQLLQNGQSVAQLPLPLDKPGADGRLLQVSRLPSAAIPVGTYELAVTVTAGNAKATRSTPFTLVD